MSRIYIAVFIIIPFINGILSATFQCGPMVVSNNNLLDASAQEQLAPCCTAYDTCFRTCNIPRAQCDCGFYKSMQTNCNNRLPGSVYCQTFAIQFYTLIILNGIPLLNGNQRANVCPATNGNGLLGALLWNSDAPTDINLCKQQK